MENAHDKINDLINKSIDELSSNVQKKTKSFFDKYKIKVKPKLVVDTALKTTTAKEKYKVFDGEIKKRNPANAMGMDSGHVVDAGIATTGDGWGAGDGWGITAFGEGISRNAANFVRFLRDTAVNDDVAKTLTDGYKSIFNSIENNSTAILCGIQPSMISYMGFDMNEFVFAMNSFMGDIISIVISEGTNNEPISVIKEWYSEIGVNDNVVNNIVFIEKNNHEYSNHSLIDFSDVNVSHNSISTLNELNEFCKRTDNPILIGCTDVYFMGELMMQFADLNKYVQIDKKFIFMIGG